MFQVRVYTLINTVNRAVTTVPPVRVLVTTRPYRRLYGLVVTSTLTKVNATRRLNI